MSILYSGIGGDRRSDGSISFLQFSTMPTASNKYVNRVVEYVGDTTSTYTNGYIYKCIGTVTEETTIYTWTRIDVQPASSGGTYTAGTGITITNNVISVDNTSAESKALISGIVINDSSTGTNTTWSSEKLNTVIGNIETNLLTLRGNV